jgi:uncharacterized protein YcfJ
LLCGVPFAAHAEITFFEHDGYSGRTFMTQGAVPNFEKRGFNDRASSAIVRKGRYEVCEHARFEGRCVVLRPGQYASLGALGLNDRISSVRPVGPEARVEEHRYSPPPPVAYDYRRRGTERLFEAEVTGVRAVYGKPQQRCWVERERMVGSEANLTGALAGAVVGGILGHQVGGGHGQEAATVAGIAAGAALGANYGRDGPTTTFTRDVQRCREVPGSARPEYWDVTYRFRGADRYVLMARPPGRFVTVNYLGEPRA